MSAIKRKKCLNCKDLFTPEPRNVTRQNYCRKPECRSASKKASQRRWLAKPENQNYFRGPENVKRVQLWREANPGYSRGKRRVNKDALQDPLNPQPVENNRNNDQIAKDALQDLLMAQPPVLLGLIANFTGFTLQDDIVMTLLRLRKLGLDLVTNLTRNKGGHYGNQVTHPAPSYPESAQAVQLDRSPPGPGSPY